MGKLKIKQEKHIPYKYKLLELFGGVGTPRISLDNLYGDCKIKSVDYVDILNGAVEAYNKLSKTCYLPQSVEKGNLDVDILVHGSPCQDFSLAGKQKGGNAGSGTRSSLLGETIKIIKHKLNKLPKVILGENVKAVLNKNHRHTFDKYLDELEKLGYVNKGKVLNGTDFGIPQCRERVFVISILNNDNAFNHFNFDNLQTTPMAPLSDFLENDVDISYYINQASMIKAVEMGKIKIIDKLATPIIEIKDNKNFINYRRNSDGKMINGAYNRVGKNDKYIGTIAATTVQKISVPLNKKNNKYEILLDKNQEPLPVFIIDGKPYHVRLLTERECWRLMGFRDEHYDKIAYLPKGAKYFLAGNSIIVNVLEAIFMELLGNKGEKNG